MDVLIGDRFIKRFLKGIRPGSLTDSTASAALQDMEDTLEPACDDGTCEDLTQDNGEFHNESQTSGQKSSIRPLPELSGDPEINGGK